MAVDGYHIVEAFTRDQRAIEFDGAVPVRVRKKIKLVDRHKFAVTYGKMRGYITKEPPETEDASKSLTIGFVNSKGERVDLPAVERPAKEPRVIQPRPDIPIGVKVVRGRCDSIDLYSWLHQAQAVEIKRNHLENQ